MSRSMPPDCANPNTGGIAAKMTSADPNAPFIRFILPSWVVDEVDPDC
jgi:hypothetical protein